MVELLSEAGLDIPGLPDGGDLADDETAKKVNQGTGRRLGQCFRGAVASEQNGEETQTLKIDEITVQRQEGYDGNSSYSAKFYSFTVAAMDSNSIAADATDDDSKGSQSTDSEPTETLQTDLSDYGAAMDAAIPATKETLVATNATIDHQHLSEMCDEGTQPDRPGTHIGESMQPIAGQSQATPLAVPEEREVLEL